MDHIFCDAPKQQHVGKPLHNSIGDRAKIPLQVWRVNISVAISVGVRYARDK